MPAISPANFDATIRHQVFLERLKSGQAADITPFLRTIDRNIRLRLSTTELTTYSRKRLNRLLAAVDQMIADELGKFSKQLTLDLSDLAVSESVFEARSLTNAVDNATFEAVIPAAARVRAIAFAAPLSVRGADGGKLLKPFLKDWSKSERDLIVNAIRQGVFEGQNNGKIMRAIRGTAAARYKNGKLAVINRHTSAVVRTMVQHISSHARQATYEANANLVKKYQWVSTLDSRTSEICQGLSGRVWNLGEGPVPPAHLQCRSVTVAVLDERFSAFEGKAQQASMFGPVDADETYYSWLKKQPVKFQNEAIGKTYATLLRKGGLSADRFGQLRLSKNFKPLNLAEMQKLEPLAFEKAGVNLNPVTGLPIG